MNSGLSLIAFMQAVRRRLDAHPPGLLPWRGGAHRAFPQWLDWFFFGMGNLHVICRSPMVGY